jgi:EF-P beta-lysylation protein EpmB
MAAELCHRPGFTSDPVKDEAATRARGVLKKYQGRALLLTTGACAIHCRYCFRRHFPYARGAMTHKGAPAALTYLAQDRDIDEVILSGGDPLMLDDPRLASLIGDIAAIPHIKRLRLHTRLPVVLPSRVTPQLCRTLTGSRFRPVVVLHVNHARELGADAREALQQLRETGSALLNQGVLLRGVNDNVPALAALSEALFESGVLPYYLHLFDRVAGAAHFEVSARRAAELLESLRARLPGYLIPRLVTEIPGMAFKSPVCQPLGGP